MFLQRTSLSYKTRTTIATATLALSAILLTAGCARNDYAAAPPPPPAANYPQVPPLVQLADRNGFDAGRSDGARDIYDGRPYRARSTRAYFDTPGFDSHLGPFDVYQNAFRNAYLRGYQKGYNRG